MNEHLNFLKVALGDSGIGAVARSSRFVIRTALRHLQGVPLRTVIEYGPGDGIMTEPLLDLMPSEGRLLAIEANAQFARRLEALTDSRLAVVHGTIQDILGRLPTFGFGPADAVVSSIPFSLIPKDERELIVRRTYEALAPGGTFVVFHQYSPLMRGTLKRVFGNVSTSFEPRNILPCFIMSAVKKEPRG